MGIARQPRCGPPGHACIPGDVPVQCQAGRRFLLLHFLQSCMPSTFFTQRNFRRAGLLLLLGLLLTTAVPARAQCWPTTASLPNGSKQGLVHTDDSSLFTIVAGGVLATRNLGQSWDLTLHSQA